MTVSGAIAADSITGKISGGGCEMRLTNQNGNIDIVKRWLQPSAPGQGSDQSPERQQAGLRQPRTLSHSS